MILQQQGGTSKFTNLQAATSDGADHFLSAMSQSDNHEVHSSPFLSGRRRGDDSAADSEPVELDKSPVNQVACQLEAAQQTIRELQAHTETQTQHINALHANLFYHARLLSEVLSSSNELCSIANRYIRSAFPELLITLQHQNQLLNTSRAVFEPILALFQHQQLPQLTNASAEQTAQQQQPVVRPATAPESNEVDLKDLSFHTENSVMDVETLFDNLNESPEPTGEDSDLLSSLESAFESSKDDIQSTPSSISSSSTTSTSSLLPNLPAIMSPSPFSCQLSQEQIKSATKSRSKTQKPKLKKPSAASSSTTELPIPEKRSLRSTTVASRAKRAKLELPLTTIPAEPIGYISGGSAYTSPDSAGESMRSRRQRTPRDIL